MVYLIGGVLSVGLFVGACYLDCIIEKKPFKPNKTLSLRDLGILFTIFLTSWLGACFSLGIVISGVCIILYRRSNIDWNQVVLRWGNNVITKDDE